MHFGKQLKFLAFPPWKREYIDYAMLKKSLNRMLEEGRKQGHTRTVTRKWITDKDGPAIKWVQKDDSSAGVTLDGGEEASAGTLKKEDEKANEDTAQDISSESNDSRNTKTSRTDLLRTKKREDASYERAQSSGDDADADGDDSSRNSLELISVVDLYPVADGDGTGDAEDVEIVVLTEELEEMFMNDFWNERDRVEAFFRDNAADCKKRLQELVALAEERRAQDIPVAPMKGEFLDLLTKCEELIDYARLNFVGFTKILKKFSHHTDYDRRAATMGQVQRAQFVCGVPEVEELCKDLKRQYITVFGRQGKSGGEDPASLMQELTRSGSAARSWKMNTILLQMEEHMSRATLNFKDKPIAMIPLIIAFTIYVLVSFIPMMSEENAPAQRALAILLAAIVMWVTECWPLFITSTLCTVLCLVSYVFMSADGQPLSPPDAVPVIYRAIIPSSIPLIVAGFCISVAWSKYGVDVMIAMKVLNLKIFRKPATFVIAVMLICFFMSAWVSNIAASLLTLTLITPVIRDLPDGCHYSKTLLLAIVIGANTGGMTTQLASPQNAVTVSLGSSSLTFVEFIIASLPVYPIIVVIGYLITIKVFPPDIDTIPSIGSEARDAAAANSSSSGYASVTLDVARSTFRRENSIKQASDRTLMLYQRLTIALTILSIALWIASNFVPYLGKDIGMVSLLVVVLFCGTGLVSKPDFERLPWALVALIAGGNVLGKAIESSKLLDLIAGLVGRLPPNLILIVIVTAIITMAASCFVSHTIISIILLPLAAKIGTPLGHSRLLVMVTNHMCSSAIAMPISSLPNLTATSLEDSRGKPYLSTADFAKIGIPVTFASFVVVCTVTFGIALLLGF